MLDKMHTAYHKTLQDLKDQRSQAYQANDKERSLVLSVLINKTWKNIEKLEKQMWGEEE
jgi:hypothetical protein